MRAQISQTKDQSFAPKLGLFLAWPRLDYQDAALSFKATACFITSKPHSGWIQLHVLGGRDSERGRQCIVLNLVSVWGGSDGQTSWVYWFCTILFFPKDNTTLHHYLLHPCVFVITLHEHYLGLCYVVCCSLGVIPLRINEALGLSRLVSHHLNQVISHFCLSVWKCLCVSVCLWECMHT